MMVVTSSSEEVKRLTTNALVDAVLGNVGI